MALNHLSKEEMLHCADKIKRMFDTDREKDRNAIKKGLNLYRQGNVSNIKVIDHAIHANVQDVTSVEVALDLNFVELSTCTCPSDDFCRHRLAVFFYGYATIDRIGRFLDDWKSSHSRPQVTKRQALPVQTAKDFYRSQSFNETSLESWLNFFEQQYEKFLVDRVQNDRYYFAGLYNRFFSTLKSYAPKSSIELKRLFTVHAGLTTFYKMVEGLEEMQLSSYEIHSYVRPYSASLIDSISENVEALKKVPLPFSFDLLLEDGLTRIQQLLTRNQALQFERFVLYRAFWSGLLNQKRWIELERNSLQDRYQKESGTENGVSFECQYGLMHLSFLGQDDKKVISWLNDFDEHGLPYAIGWIETLNKSENWKRLKPWLTYALDHMENYIVGVTSYDGKRQMTRYLLQLFTDYAANSHSDYELVQSMQKLLPYSYAEYNHYLFQKEDYQTWVDLQLLLGFDISEFDRHLIKTIEEKDRSTLLPLYHQAVNQALLQKNRKSYKQAVKYLKKLRTHYRRLKKEHQWEAYFEQLVTMHKRLRAFQEELKRGKLLQD